MNVWANFVSVHRLFCCWQNTTCHFHHFLARVASYEISLRIIAVIASSHCSDRTVSVALSWDQLAKLGLPRPGGFRSSFPVCSCPKGKASKLGLPINVFPCWLFLDINLMILIIGQNMPPLYTTLLVGTSLQLRCEKSWSCQQPLGQGWKHVGFRGHPTSKEPLQ